ncbi:MAG: hypothetical protein LUG50_06565 [Planctomycetaceae bacterium]|nr:hypothetical protein [Planctomycetaceae bacterium]
MSARSRRLPSRTVPDADAGEVKACVRPDSVSKRDRVSRQEKRLIVLVLSLLIVWALSVMSAAAGEENLMALRGRGGGIGVNRFVTTPDLAPELPSAPPRAVRVASVNPVPSPVVTTGMQPVQWKNGCARTRIMVGGVPLELAGSDGFGLTPPFVRTAESGHGGFIRLLLEELSG